MDEPDPGRVQAAFGEQPAQLVVGVETVTAGCALVAEHELQGTRGGGGLPGAVVEAAVAVLRPQLGDAVSDRRELAGAVRLFPPDQA